MNREIEIAINRARKYDALAGKAWRAVKALKDKCEHYMVSKPGFNPFRDDMFCRDCGHEPEGWYCPKNTRSYECEYPPGCGYCSHCGKPEERT